MEIPSFNALIQQSIIDHWDMDALTDYKGATLQYHDVARKIEKLHIMFENSVVVKGDKIAFVGRNGEGKSTLVKCIMGQLQNEGKLELGHNVQIGYFAQNQASLLDGELTVFQTIDDVAKGEIRNKIRDLLGAFMFGGEDSTKKVKVLSGGERTRLAILKLLLEPVNLLILDERPFSQLRRLPWLPYSPYHPCRKEEPLRLLPIWLSGNRLSREVRSCPHR